MQIDQINKVAKLTAMIGSPARLKILQVLANAPRTVEDIAEQTNETVGNTSQHLQKLLSINLVKVEKNGVLRIYTLTSTKTALIIDELFNLVDAISEKLYNTNKNENSLSSKSPLSISEVLDEVKKNKAILIDVRDEHESTHTPVPFSITIPIEKLNDALKKMSKNKSYYIFCRSRACTDADRGVIILKNLGFTAYRLNESPQVLIDNQLNKKNKRR
jgi:DNA-binding transcriptional ArsR family regulator/rhodanese-related sulfurtransferase